MTAVKTLMVYPLKQLTRFASKAYRFQPYKAQPYLNLEKQFSHHHVDPFAK